MFVFEADVLGCRGMPNECAKLKRDYIDQSCWGPLIELQKCEHTTVTKICFEARSKHLSCLSKARDDIEEKLARLKQSQ